MVRQILHESPKIDVVDARKEDIPAIADVWVDAFVDDLLVKIGLPDRNEMRKKCIEGLETIWGAHELWALVAREISTGRIIGVALWVWFDRFRDTQHDLLARCIATTSLRPSSSSAQIQGPGQSRQGLMESVNDKLVKMRNEWLRGKRSSYLGLLAVSSHAQGKGVGSKLLQSGLDRSDKEGWTCYLEASPAGYPLYARRSFMEVGALETDLSEWAGKNKGYGIYRHTSMIRLPTALTS